VVISGPPLPGPQKPCRRLAVVKPERQDEDGARGHIYVRRVVILDAVALGGSCERRCHEARPDGFLDLVGLARLGGCGPFDRGSTVLFVRQDCASMRGATGRSCGLADVAAWDIGPAAYHWVLLWPPNQCGGALGQADSRGAICLACDDPHEAQSLAEKLDLF